jgi:hypothetical protein
VTRRPRLSAAADSRPRAVQSSLARIGNQACQAEAGRSGLPAPEAAGEPATCRLTLPKPSKRSAAPVAVGSQPSSRAPPAGEVAAAPPGSAGAEPDLLPSVRLSVRGGAAPLKTRCGLISSYPLAAPRDPPRTIRPLARWWPNVPTGTQNVSGLRGRSMVVLLR